METEKRHQGKTVVITGGETGIGREIARAFLERGAFVELIGISEPDLISTQKEFGDHCAYQVHNITNTDNTRAIIEIIGGRRKSIDVLINNAGIHQKKPTDTMTVAEFQEMLSVHFTGAFALVREVLPYMKKQRSGNILFMASMAALIGLPEVVSYAAAKSALVGMVKSLTSEVSEWGIRVNAIAPGWIDTPLLRMALEGDGERRNRILNRTPMKRFGGIEDIADAASFLCSQEAKFITGIVLPVDGGASIGF